MRISRSTSGLAFLSVAIVGILITAYAGIGSRFAAQTVWNGCTATCPGAYTPVCASPPFTFPVCIGGQARCGTASSGGNSSLLFTCIPVAPSPPAGGSQCIPVGGGRSIRFSAPIRVGGENDFMLDPAWSGPRDTLYVSADGSVVEFRQDGYDASHNQLGGYVVFDQTAGTTTYVSRPPGITPLNSSPLLKDGTKFLLLVRINTSVYNYWVYDRATANWSGPLSSVPYSGLDMQTNSQWGGGSTLNEAVAWGQMDANSPNTTGLWAYGTMVRPNVTYKSAIVSADGRTIVYAVVGSYNAGAYPGYKVFMEHITDCSSQPPPSSSAQGQASSAQASSIFSGASSSAPPSTMSSVASSSAPPSTTSSVASSIPASSAKASSVGFCGPVCGDNIVMAPEECDNGSRNSNTGVNACRTTCKKAHCGDGAVDSGEVCDHGNNNGTSGDACLSNCQLTTVSSGASSAAASASCGNGKREGTEACDDGNKNNGDGCSSTCVVEGGWQCLPPGNVPSTGGSSSVVASVPGASSVAGQPASSSAGISSAPSFSPQSSSAPASAASSVAQVTCIDTEVDPNPTVQGTVTLSTGQTFTDSCTAMHNGGITMGAIVEDYCWGGGHTFSQISCPLGTACSNGACQPVPGWTPPPVPCSDSDGGFNLGVKGSGVSGITPFADTCVGNLIYEYYCTGGTDPSQWVVHAVSDAYHCPNGTTCSNGACQ